MFASWPSRSTSVRGEVRGDGSDVSQSRWAGCSAPPAAGTCERSCGVQGERERVAARPVCGRPPGLPLAATKPGRRLSRRATIRKAPWPCAGRRSIPRGPQSRRMSRAPGAECAVLAHAPGGVSHLAGGVVWRSAKTSLTVGSVSCPITPSSCCRPAPIADGSQRQQDPPHQEPQLPDPDVPAQRRPVHASRRVDDAQEDERAKQHGQAAVHHEQGAGPGCTGQQPHARNHPSPRAYQRQQTTSQFRQRRHEGYQHGKCPAPAGELPHVSAVVLTRACPSSA